MRCPRRWTTSALFVSVGPEGLEPSPGGLRVRCAAASTLIPLFRLFCAQNRRGGNRTLDFTLIRGTLSPLSYAPVGPKGLEPLLAGLKGRCAAVTPRPQNAGRVYRVSIVRASSLCSLYPVVALRVELSATRLSAEFGQPALDYRRFLKSGWQESNLRLRAPKARGFAATLHPAAICSVRTAGFEPAVSRSPTWRDTRLRYVLFFSDPYRSRTGLPALKGRRPRTDRLAGPCRRIFSTQLKHGFCAHFHAVGRAVLESASPGFQPSATPSQLPTQKTSGRRGRCRPRPPTRPCVRFRTRRFRLNA